MELRGPVRGQIQDSSHFPQHKGYLLHPVFLSVQDVSMVCKGHKQLTWRLNHLSMREKWSQGGVVGLSWVI